MSLDLPIIKTFIYDNKFYCYDTNKNYIIELNKELYNELQKIKKIGLSKYLEENEKNELYYNISNLIKKGFFAAKIFDRIEHIDTNNVDIFCERAVNQIVLGITNLCNFKCRYCHQAEGKLLSMQNMMSEEVAFKSIDFLHEHSKDFYEVTITFYGGEPLLNFELIKKCVKYANQKFKSKRIKYNTTTNASLLTNEIIDFFYENNFSLLISLDGDKTVQNRHRKFLSNGEGTFDIVYNNVLKIKCKYPVYFKEQVGFNAVLLSDDNPNDSLHFFEENDLFEGGVSIKRADMTGIDYTISPLLYKNNFDNEYLDKTQYEDMLIIYNNKKVINKVWHHNGPCIPGIRRLFINAEGQFYPCEKVNSDISCNIGNLCDGFNNANIKKLMNIGKITENECKKCWAMRFCKICAYHCTDNNVLSKEKKLINCETQKKSVMDFFEKYLKNIKEDKVL